MWLEYQTLKNELPGTVSKELDGDESRAVQAWNLMDGQVIWPSINDIAEYLEVVNIELFIDALLLIKEHCRPLPE